MNASNEWMENTTKVKKARGNKPNKRRQIDDGRIVYKRHHQVEWADNTFDAKKEAEEEHSSNIGSIPNNHCSYLIIMFYFCINDTNSSYIFKFV